MMTQRMTDAAVAALERLRSAGWRCATAESCTGGLVAGALTSISGSSRMVDCGFVTYSNEAKTRMLDVPAALIAAHGAVSRECAQAMAVGALARSGVDVAVSITGIAGPDGGSKAKPVGLVYLAAATKTGCEVVEKRFGALTRDEIREKSVIAALEMMRSS